MSWLLTIHFFFILLIIQEPENNESEPPYLTAIDTGKPWSPPFETLALSLDWSNRLHSTSTPNLITSYSNGHLCLQSLTPTGLMPLSHWRAHDLEVWIGAFDAHNPSLVYSGSDDGIFKTWDTRTPSPTSPSSSPSTSSPVQVMRSKVHEAGVTTFESHPTRPYSFVTGSYDEKVRLWDTRMGTQNSKAILQEINVGGGIWRLKWHPKRMDTLLVAAMYGGVIVLDLKKENPLVQSYQEHRSIAYGADWSFDPQFESTPLIGSCSFYDHSFHLYYSSL